MSNRRKYLVGKRASVRQACESQIRRQRPLRVETFEQRLVLDCSMAECLQIELFPEFDQFGSQVETVQAYHRENDYVMQSPTAGTSDWTNLQMTWNQTTGEMRIFQDGAEVEYLVGFDQRVRDWAEASSGAGVWNFGLDDTGASHFAGAVDDIAWFDQVLNQQQLAALRSQGVSGAQGSLGGDLVAADNGGHLIAHWDFDQFAGANVSGAGGTSVTLALQGGPTADAQGVFGQAIRFDGLNDQAQFNSPNNQMGTTGTLNMWLRLDDPQAQHNLFTGPDGGLNIQYQPGQVVASANQFATEPLVAFSIYDTGASVVTVSAQEQLLNELLGVPGIPIMVPNGAEASAIGGTLVGDVSFPGVITADGLHAAEITAAGFGTNFDFSAAAKTHGVQVFVGNADGSGALPTITGVPIHAPSPTHPDGAAAKIEMRTYQLDLCALLCDLVPELEGLILDIPDLHLVEPGERLAAGADTTAPVRVPLALWGESNIDDSGDTVTAFYNPVQENVRFDDAGQSVTDQVMLFDTGAQLTVISSQIANDLGLNLQAPDTTIDVQGAAGVPLAIPGFTLDSLELPRDDDGDGAVDGVLQLSQVPVYVLDLIEGLDGILGMNLFNQADTLLYDPFDPSGASLQLSFVEDFVPEVIDPEDMAQVQLLADQLPVLAAAIPGQNVPNFGVLPETLSGELLHPPTGAVSYDSGYLDIHWSALGAVLFEVDPATVDVNDISITSANPLTVDRVEALGNNTYRYFYGDDGEQLAEGVVEVEFVGGQVVDIYGTPSAQQTVTFTMDSVPPQVVDVVVNGAYVDPNDLLGQSQPTDWQTQRSRVMSLKIEFDSAVALQTDDLRLVNLGQESLAEPNSIIPLSHLQVAVAERVVTVTFDADELPDGVYQLEVGSAVVDLAGNQLDGNQDGTGGDAFTLTGSAENGLYQLTGDFNGDAGTSIFDFSTLSYWFGTLVPDAPLYADINLDGGVSIFDIGEFARKFGSTVPRAKSLRGVASFTSPTTQQAEQIQIETELLAQVEAERTQPLLASHKTCRVDDVAELPRAGDNDTVARDFWSHGAFDDWLNELWCDLKIR